MHKSRARNAKSSPFEFNITYELDEDTHPVEGGSANDYDYANQDCVNSYDLDGKAVVAVAWGMWVVGNRIIWTGEFAFHAYKCVRALKAYNKFEKRFLGRAGSTGAREGTPIGAGF